MNNIKISRSRRKRRSEGAQVPLKEFMLKQTKKSSLNLYMDMADVQLARSESPEDLSMTVIVPAFMTSELKRAFVAGFLLFIPFLLIDIIVSSTLMSMGMIMLPPAMVQLAVQITSFYYCGRLELTVLDNCKKFSMKGRDC